MESLYNFIKKQSKLELLSEQIEKGYSEKAQKTLNEILLERTLYMGITKKNNLENEIDRALKIYIAGPYTPKNASAHDAARIAHENTVDAINFGIDTIDKGHLPYIPHLSHFMHLYGKETLSYEYYTKADIEWLNDCDAILYYHPITEESKGADNELKIAIGSGKTVFFSPYEIPRHVSAKKQEI
ncbi:hypothetical protein M1494_03495 [Candidatus Parvarchaeota archaeon]|nr:hypothetical protein [Candidatus Parvarchaeota archaeon]